MTSYSPSDPSPDAGLIERIKEGDEKAFAEFYDLLAARLFGLIFKILGDAREAEDVLQESFLHIWNKAAAYDPSRTSPSTWAFMIVRSKAIDCLRARDRRQRKADRAAAEPLYVDGPERTAVTEVTHHENAEAVNSALDEIPADQKEALHLAFFGGLTHVEIAERLKTPVGTIKARIRRGLMKMAERLGRAR